MTLRQSMTPARIQGRMGATMRTIGWGALLIGSFTGGILGTMVGVVPTIWSGALGLLLAVVPIVAGPIAGIREFPRPTDEPDASVSPTVEPRDGAPSATPA